VGKTESKSIYTLRKTFESCLVETCGSGFFHGQEHRMPPAEHVVGLAQKQDCPGSFPLQPGRQIGWTDGALTTDPSCGLSEGRQQHSEM